MYRKDSNQWIKHIDFIILDLICLQIAFVLAYAVSGYGFNPYKTMIYRNMAVFIGGTDLVLMIFMGTLKNVLKRGYYKNCGKKALENRWKRAVCAHCFLL